MYTGYWIQDNFIFGTKESGKFWIDNDFICRPSKNLPWFE